MRNKHNCIIFAFKCIYKKKRKEEENKTAIKANIMCEKFYRFCHKEERRKTFLLNFLRSKIVFLLKFLIYC